MSYICLTGEEVHLHEDESIFSYDKNMLAPYLTCPISQTWICDPVVVNGNIYDSSSVKQWLATSNIDPLTGEEWPQELILFKFNLLKFLLYMFEERDETLIFHSCPNTLRYAQDLGEYLPVQKSNLCEEYFSREPFTVTKTYDFKDQNLSVTAIMRQYVFKSPTVLNDRTIYCHDLRNCNAQLVNCKLVNCLCSPSDLTDCSIVDNIRCYTLEDYLFTNPFTGTSWDDSVYLTRKGYMLPKGINETKIIGYTSDSREEYIRTKQSSQATEITKIVNGFRDLLKPKNILEITPSFESYWYPRFVRKIPPIDIVLRTRSKEELVYERIVFMKQHIETHKHLSTALTKVADLVTNETMKKDYGTNNCLLKNARERMGLPFLIDQDSNTYGKDLSLLNLSNRTFTSLSLKDYSFSGCTFHNTKFINCEFMGCCFVGANLSRCTFSNCKFLSCRRFYKTIASPRTEFIRCTSPDNIFGPLFEQM